MDTLDAITQAILTYGPAVVSIVTMVCTVIISIKKVASTTKDSLAEVKEIKKTNEELKSDMGALIQENAELKKELRKCVNRFDHIAEVDNGK